MSSEPSLVDELWESLVTAVIAAAAALWWLLRRPWLLGAALVAAGVILAGGWTAGALALGITVAVLAGLRWLRPDLFARLVSRPLRRAQTGSHYRRDWGRVTDLCGLTRDLDGRTLRPDLLRVQVGSVSDRLLLRMVTGQSLADYERACPQLAASLGGHLAQVWADEPGRLWLAVIRADALADIIPAQPIPTTDEVDRVTVGVREDARPWVLRLLGTHVFVAGVQGAGKGSVIWSVLRGLAPPIHTGTVQVWAVDPKGGMELAFGRPLFTRFACENTAAMVELLEDAVTVMDQRCARLAGVTRMHQPTVDEPLVLVIVDELSTLTAYEPDTKLRNRATAAISALLARGRAAAVVVLAAAQDPRKEVVSFRSLFPTKVVLRLDTPSQVDMVLGDGMCSSPKPGPPCWAWSSGTTRSTATAPGRHGRHQPYRDLVSSMTSRQRKQLTLFDLPKPGRRVRDSPTPPATEAGDDMEPSTPTLRAAPTAAPNRSGRSGSRGARRASRSDAQRP